MQLYGVLADVYFIFDEEAVLIAKRERIGFLIKESDYFCRNG